MNPTSALGENPKDRVAAVQRLPKARVGVVQPFSPWISFWGGGVLQEPSIPSRPFGEQVLMAAILKTYF